MIADPTPSDKSARLKTADQVMAASPTGDRTAGDPVLPCDATPRKDYHYIGVGIALQQYPIGSRSEGLNLPARANSTVADMTVLNAAKDSALVPANSSDKNPCPLKLYPPGTSLTKAFLGEVTMGASRLIVESTVPGYQADGTENAWLNKLLGQSLGLHYQRSGILRPTGTGNFQGSFLGAQETGLNNTEMMGAKVYIYVRMELNGKQGIYEVVDGALNATALTEDEYKDRVLIINSRDNTPKIQYRDEYCGGMPLIPGVYQVHVLIESAGNGTVSLKEVYCDGDPLYSK